jgi:hypothetical protein
MNIDVFVVSAFIIWGNPNNINNPSVNTKEKTNEIRAAVKTVEFISGDSIAQGPRIRPTDCRSQG